MNSGPLHKKDVTVAKLSPTPTLAPLVLLAALLACTSATPAPDPNVAPTQDPVVTTALLTDHKPTTGPTATQTQPPEQPPTETTTAAPTRMVTQSPRLLAPLSIQDSQALQSSLLETELVCIGNDPETLTRSLTGAVPSSKQEQAKLLGCLEDETLARIFLDGFVPGPDPLSPESSQCVRAAFDVIDPRKVMTAGPEGNSGAALAGSMAAFTVTMACLNDEEWATASAEMGLRPEERHGMQCLMETLGGPGEMAEAMIAAQEGDLTTLVAAGEECGLDMAPNLGRTPPPSSGADGDRGSNHAGRGSHHSL